MDASILLPPTGTPLTGIDFVKRLPCGDVEKTRRVSESWTCLSRAAVLQDHSWGGRRGSLTRSRAHLLTEGQVVGRKLPPPTPPPGHTALCYVEGLKCYCIWHQMSVAGRPASVVQSMPGRTPEL